MIKAGDIEVRPILTTTVRMNQAFLFMDWTWTRKYDIDEKFASTLPEVENCHSNRRNFRPNDDVYVPVKSVTAILTQKALPHMCVIIFIRLPPLKYNDSDIHFER